MLEEEFPYGVYSLQFFSNGKLRNITLLQDNDEPKPYPLRQLEIQGVCETDDKCDWKCFEFEK